VPIDAHAHLPEGLQRALEARLARLSSERVIERVWAGDHTVWKPHPTEIANRLGWLQAPWWAAERVDELGALRRELLDEGFTDLLLMGMGGSSLAASVLAALAEVEGLRFHLLDTTNPEEIAAIEQAVDLERTLFVVASKSGTTIETVSHLAYFWERLPRGSAFVAITDDGTPLARLAAERGFRRLLLNPADIGGRYSALSYFGLGPAVLCGLDPMPLLGAAQEMATACKAPAAENPAAWLGVLLGEAARAGRDKLHLFLPPDAPPLAAWIEQLVAESTGKDGVGILPVNGDGLIGRRADALRDRIVVADSAWGGELPEEVPAVRLPAEARGAAIGAAFFRWEFATAIAGHVLAINPFDQPNVQEAKDATAQALQGALPPVEPDPLPAVLEELRPGWYAAILAWVAETDEHDARLRAAAERLQQRSGCPVTLGYGPRYLHSTGQLHKGGSDRGVFIQVVGPRAVDLPVPGKPYTFGQLYDAQAAGDLASLRARGRRVARVTLEELEEALQS